MDIKNKTQCLFRYIKISFFLFLLSFAAMQGTAMAMSQQKDFLVDDKYDLYGRSQSQAFLAHESENALFYLEKEYFDSLAVWQREGVMSQIVQAGKDFDEVIYPTTKDIFGDEWNPGIDNESRIVILLTRLNHNVGGYFNPNDEYKKESVVGGRSNENEMIYLNVNFLSGGKIAGFLAHELQHMIYWNEKYRLGGGSEEVWINEARSELASAIVEEQLGKNFSEGSLAIRKRDFLLNYNDSLVSWGNMNHDYASVSMFMQYFKDRFGTDIFREMNSTRKVGAYNLNFVLEKNKNVSLAQVFSDWTLANYLNDTTIDMKYGYNNRNLKSGFNVVPGALYDKDGDGKIKLYNNLENWSAEYYKIDLSTVQPETYVEVLFNGSDYGVFSIPMVINYKNGVRKIENFSLDSAQDGSMEFFSADGSISSIVLIPSSVNINEALQNNQPKRYTFSLDVNLISPDEKVRADGTLIRFSGEEKVYLIESGKKRWITDSATFVARGYDWNGIILISEAELAIYPEGEYIKREVPLIISDALVKGSGPKVYLLENGTRRWIKDEITFNSWGYDWKNVVLLTDQELMLYGEGEPLLASVFSDGTLVRGSGPQVYFIEAGKKRWITSPESFARNGFSWLAIIQIPDRSLFSYPIGLNIE